MCRLVRNNAVSTLIAFDLEHIDHCALHTPDTPTLVPNPLSRISSDQDMSVPRSALPTSLVWIPTDQNLPGVNPLAWNPSNQSLSGCTLDYVDTQDLRMQDFSSLTQEKLMSNDYEITSPATQSDRLSASLLFFLALLTQSLIDHLPECVGSPLLHAQIVTSLHPWISLMQSLWDTPNAVKTFLIVRCDTQHRSPLIGDRNDDLFVFHIVSICRQIRDLNATTTHNTTSLPSMDTQDLSIVGSPMIDSAFLRCSCRCDPFSHLQRMVQVKENLAEDLAKHIC
jgi:hypothetical protein